MSDAPLAAGTTPERLRRGAGYVLRGLRFLAAHPDLAIWAAVPALVQLVLLVGAAWLCLVSLPAWLGTFGMPQVGPLAHLFTGLVYTAALAALVAMSVAIHLASGLIGAPFYDRLSADVEAIVNGPPADEPSWRTVLGDIGLSMAHSGLALGLWVVCQLVFTLFNALPVLGGLIELGSGVTVSSLFMARELMDGSLSRRRMSFRHKVRTVLANGPLLGGFGAAAGAILWVPVLNTVTMPACVIAATLLVCDLERQGLIPEAGGPLAVWGRDADRAAGHRGTSDAAAGAASSASAGDPPGRGPGSRAPTG